MKKGLGIFLWQLAVALYLIAVGILAFSSKGQLVALLEGVFGSMKNGNPLFIVAGIIAFIGGLGVLLDMFDVKIASFMDTLVLIIAIIWAVFIVFQIIGWVGNSFKDFWSVLSQISVNIMVCSSLLAASKKFG